MTQTQPPFPYIVQVGRLQQRVDEAGLCPLLDKGLAGAAVLYWTGDL